MTGQSQDVSMAWVRLMGGTARRKGRKEGKRGRKERVRGQGRGEACTNEPQRVCCGNAILVQSKLTFKG